MPRKRNVHVVPHNGRWATKRERGQRAGSLHDTQRSAIDRAKTQAIRDKVEVVIHRPDGRIRDSDSYGPDPLPPRDKQH